MLLHTHLHPSPTPSRQEGLFGLLHSTQDLYYVDKSCVLRASDRKLGSQFVCSQTGGEGSLAHSPLSQTSLEKTDCRVDFTYLVLDVSEQGTGLCCMDTVITLPQGLMSSTQGMIPTCVAAAWGVQYQLLHRISRDRV